MATFYQSNNNGVTAIISFEHAKLHYQAKQCGGDPWKLGVKVFTFCHKERLDRNPEERRFFSGTHEFMRKVLEGHVLSTHGSGGWDGFVPYSNQDFEDTRYLTTPEDVCEIFGLVRAR